MSVKEDKFDMVWLNELLAETEDEVKKFEKRAKKVNDTLSKLHSRQSHVQGVIRTFKKGRKNA